MRVLHISDMHLSTDRRNLIRWVDTVQAFDPTSSCGEDVSVSRVSAHGYQDSLIRLIMLDGARGLVSRLSACTAARSATHLVDPDPGWSVGAHPDNTPPETHDLSEHPHLPQGVEVVAWGGGPYYLPGCVSWLLRRWGARGIA